MFRSAVTSEVCRWTGDLTRGSRCCETPHSHRQTSTGKHTDRTRKQGRKTVGFTGSEASGVGTRESKPKKSAGESSKLQRQSGDELVNRHCFYTGKLMSDDETQLGATGADDHRWWGGVAGKRVETHTAAEQSVTPTAAASHYKHQQAKRELTFILK